MEDTHTMSFWGGLVCRLIVGLFVGELTLMLVDDTMIALLIAVVVAVWPLKGEGATTLRS